MSQSLSQQQLLMASTTSQASLTNNGAAEYYHELIDAGDALALEEGENWLHLAIGLAKAGNNNVLDGTQEAMPLGAPFPSILSLKEMGSIDAPSSDCFIGTDVDGPIIAVKDMRPLTDNSLTDDQDDDHIDKIEVCIQRRKFPVQDLDDDEDEETNYHPPDVLPRRQLRCCALVIEYVHEDGRKVATKMIASGFSAASEGRSQKRSTIN
jgi:hypothetical protein